MQMKTQQRSERSCILYINDKLDRVSLSLLYVLSHSFLSFVHYLTYAFSTSQLAVAFMARIHSPRVKPAILTARVNVGSGAEILHVGRACESALKIVVDVSGLWLLCWESKGERGEKREEKCDLVCFC